MKKYVPWNDPYWRIWNRPFSTDEKTMGGSKGISWASGAPWQNKRNTWRLTLHDARWHSWLAVDGNQKSGINSPVEVTLDSPNDLQGFSTNQPRWLGMGFLNHQQNHRRNHCNTQASQTNGAVQCTNLGNQLRFVTSKSTRQLETKLEKFSFTSWCSKSPNVLFTDQVNPFKPLDALWNQIFALERKTPFFGKKNWWISLLSVQVTFLTNNWNIFGKTVANDNAVLCNRLCSSKLKDFREILCHGRVWRSHLLLH